MGMLYKVNGLYYYGVKVKGRWVRRSSGSACKKVAQQMQDQARLRIAQGLPLDENESTKEEGKAGQTLAEFAEEYIGHKARSGLRVDRDRECFRHILSHLGEKPLGEIDREMVEDYIEERLQGAKPDTVQRELNVFKASLNKAIVRKRIAANPAARITVPGANKPRRRLLSGQEIEWLLEACSAYSPTLRDLVECALQTGMRRGELLSLREEDCDFLREEIRIWQTKTGEARAVPMHKRVKAILWNRVQGRQTAKVFPIVNVPRPFQAAVKKVGLRDVRFHDLRRCAASYMLMHGVDVPTTQKILGHTDPRMTLRVYTMITTDHMRKAVQGLPAFGKSDMTRTNRVEKAEKMENLETVNVRKD